MTKGFLDTGTLLPMPPLIAVLSTIFVMFLACGLVVSMEKIELDGDIILGGLFPMHEAGNNQEGSCGAIKEEKGIQRMEAMLYAIQSINKNPFLLPNVTLGALILDTCSCDTYALEQSMEFIRLSMDEGAYKCNDGSTPTFHRRKPIAGVIGASSSSVSVMVANILQLFKIPQISYASTSVELSDKSRFEFFSRVVPPDNFQAQALVEVIQKLRWNYVSTVFSEGEYGEKGIENFKMHALKADICIAASEKIPRQAKEEDFDRIIEQLYLSRSARGVILFVDEDNCRKLLAASLRANKTDHFRWVGSDSWGAKAHPVKGQEEAAVGAITILPKRFPLQGFDDYFLSLSIYDEARNPWFRNFWEQHFNCTLNHTNHHVKPCTGEEKYPAYRQEGLVPLVVDAVYAMSYAIHNMIHDKCDPPNELCSALRPVPPGKELLQYIRNVSFPSPQGRGMTVKFDKDGNAPGSYHIYQFQKFEDEYQYRYVLIGEWKESLILNESLLNWNAETAPESICSTPCSPVQIRVFTKDRPCCWMCVSCREEEFIATNSCKACPLGHFPSEDRMSCIMLPIQHMTWDSPWSIVPVSFASFGILCSVFAFSVFLKYNNTPIIMASGRELCYVLLFGVILCYTMTFVILAKPAITTCTLLRVGMGLGLCISYASIFTKTNRISRIFNRGAKSIRRPHFTSPKSQVVICLCIVSVQLMLSISWLIIEPPKLRVVYPTPRMAVLQCGISGISLVVSLIYNMILIVLCTIYAFKTRKIPENFNEAKYIGFTMYSNCIVWLAFIPIYFGTNNDFRVQLASLCMCISISATAALGCLFCPKIYIVIFQPYKNVRPGTQASFHSMRFSRPTASAALASVAAATVFGGTRHIDTDIDFRSTTINGEVTSPSIEDSSVS